MSRPASDPRTEGLREFLGNNRPPKIVTSEHTMEQMTDSLLNGTRITVTGYQAPVVVLEYKELPTEASEHRLTQTAEVRMDTCKESFIVYSIVREEVYHGKPNFIIRGSEAHEEWGNYYGTNTWTTYTNLKYFGSDGRFEFWDEPK